MIGIKNSVPALLFFNLFFSSSICWSASSAPSPSSPSSFTFAYCQPSPELHPEVQDKLLQVTALVKQELEQSGQSVALISRSGLSLQRWGLRYSHAGISLKNNVNNANGAWSVRQLYFACDENRPRIFDQGMTGFVMGANQPEGGHISIVFLPANAAQLLERAALDNAQALRLLGATYSANAYAFSLLYQNCNQWVIELIASAWAGQHPSRETPRASAQQWLRIQNYQPSTIQVGWLPLMWVSRLVPWLHTDDHPQEDWDAAQYRVSMPQSIEAFIHTQLPEAQRVEICYTAHRIHIQRGWDAMQEECEN